MKTNLIPCTTNPSTCAQTIIAAPHLPASPPRFRRNVLGVEVLVKSFVTSPAGTVSCG